MIITIAITTTWLVFGLGFMCWRARDMGQLDMGDVFIFVILGPLLMPLIFITFLGEDIWNREVWRRK